MEILQKLHNKIPSSSPATISPDRLSNRANRSFQETTSLFLQCMEDRCESIRSGYCFQELRIYHPHQPVHLKLSYHMKNMLLSRGYDLIIESSIPLSEADPDMELELSYRGIFKIKSAGFRALRGGPSASALVEKLNLELIKSRLLSQQPSQLTLHYEQETGRLKLSMHLLKGSVSWCLIPPIYQHIPLKQKDCVEIVEIFQLITKVIRCYDK